MIVAREREREKGQKGFLDFKITSTATLLKSSKPEKMDLLYAKMGSVAYNLAAVDGHRHR